MAQICDKAPKCDTPLFLFLHTHAGGMFMAHSIHSLPLPYFQSGERSFASLQVEENQNCVPICSLVHSQIESNSSHDPKTLQSCLFYWNK